MSKCKPGEFADLYAKAQIAGAIIGMVLALLYLLLGGA